MSDFHRKHIRLSAPRYIGLKGYFLTMCTEGRLIRFRNAELVKSLLGLLSQSSKAAGFVISAYCFMPDHLHILTGGVREDSDLLKFTKGFKQRSGYLYRQSTGERLWQKKYYDHILRPNERWEAVAWYIWMNPVRKELCARPEDWPFSGSFTVDWRTLLAPPEEPWIPPWEKGLTSPRP